MAKTAKILSGMGPVLIVSAGWLCLVAGLRAEALFWGTSVCRFLPDFEDPALLLYLPGASVLLIADGVWQLVIRKMVVRERRSLATSIANLLGSIGFCWGVMLLGFTLFDACRCSSLGVDSIRQCLDAGDNLTRTVLFWLNWAGWLLSRGLWAVWPKARSR